jgi:glycosyltransferase involved in cell wall biosynthesis
VIYDLIPLIHPEFAYPGIDKAFANWIKSIGSESDSLIAISKSVADDVRAWLLEKEHLKMLPHISHFHLGADIHEGKLEAEDNKNQFESIFTAVKKSPTFLMVGTLEPRKGHAQTLAAFEALWKQGVEVNLIVVGKEGWAVEKLCERLKNHPELSKRLFWLDSISDHALAAMYSHTCCLIAASEAEGFGLPLIEAAQRKLPIIARDIPVFREVAGESAFYFKGGTEMALATALQQWLQMYEAGTHPSSTTLPWLHWHESVEQLKSNIFLNGGD